MPVAFEPAIMMTWQIIRLIFLIGLLLILFLCETIRPVRPWHNTRWQRWRFHITISAINTFLTRTFALGLILVWIAYVREQSWGLVQFLKLSGWVEMISTLVLFDILNYWWHRWNHRVSFLWRFHRVHHIDTHVDTSTALRFHFGELFLSYLVKTIWIFVWGPSLAAFLVFETAITAYALFHHTNINFPDLIERKLRLIHMTPRVHASHHTVTLRTRDANFSTIFLWWDYLFGTFQEPDDSEMKTLGVTPKPIQDLSFTLWFLSPFKPFQ